MIRQYFEGRVTLRIQGYNLSRLMRNLAKDYTIYNYRFLEAHLIEFALKSKDVKTVIALCKEMCYNVEIIAQKGARAHLAGGKKRLGLIIVVLVVAALLGAFNSFIWAIEIDGNERVLKSDIEKTLNFAGISEGIFKGKISASSVENLLTATFKDISMVQVKTKGVLLKINIVETLEKSDQLNRDSLSSIRASEDGRVEGLIVYQGTPLVKNGDFVKKGEELIASYEDRLLPDGITYERLFMKALGEVELTTYYTHEIVFSTTAVEYVRTGKSTTISSLQFMGLRFFRRGKNPYSYYEGESGEIELFKNTLLPIKKYQTVVYELKRVEVEREYASVSSQLEAQALSEARFRVKDPTKIIDEYVNVHEKDGVYRITGVVLVREIVRAE